MIVVSSLLPRVQVASPLHLSEVFVLPLALGGLSCDPVFEVLR
jgi:hypothetical protein